MFDSFSVLARKMRTHLIDFKKGIQLQDTNYLYTETWHMYRYTKLQYSSLG